MKLFQLYVSKLNPKRDDLWQKPKKDVSTTDQVWYDNVPVGPHPLDNFMKGLAERAQLSKPYTNHCIRSTCITNLDESGFEARHITAVSGHKSETTIKNYSVKCPDKKKRQMSDALSEKLLPNAFANSSPATKKAKLTHTEVVANSDKNENLDLNFLDWIPIENNSDDFDLGQIITEVDKMQNDPKRHQTIATTSVTHPTTIPTTNFVSNFTQNNASMAQTFPFLPRMIFPNSNVTINYNFNTK